MKLEKYKQRNPKKIGITFINGNVVDPGDLYFVFYVDGVISSTMPAKGDGYVLDKEKTTCTNGASVEWLDDEWAPKINNLTQTRTKCTLYFKEETFADILLACNDTAANCLKNNAAKNPTELADDETTDHNIRYIGANPNNYVTFNNELWRIIGVFNNIDNGRGTKETRIKLIRDEPIGSYSWDNKLSGTGSSTSSYGSNDWTDSTLKEILNNGPYWNRVSGNCPSGSNGATKACDFSTNGLTEEAKTMISDAVWNLGGSSTYNDVTASMFYERERGIEVYNDRPTEWTGKIGLMYPSDYGYATSGGSTTNREACLNKELYNWASSSECPNNDWLYKSGTYQWTLTPSARYSYYAFIVASFGNVNDYSYRTYNPIGVFPALYLNSNVKIVSGEGTESDPFVLEL